MIPFKEIKKIKKGFYKTYQKKLHQQYSGI